MRSSRSPVATASAGEAYAREWGIPRVHVSYETLIDDPEIDAIYNPLPNALHAAWTIRAVRAGKHVLCEKPLATTVAESMRSRGRRRPQALSSPKRSCTGTTRRRCASRRWSTNVRSAELRLIRSAFTFPLTRTIDVRWEPSLGGGSLWDVGCYPISIARLLAGVEPQEVFGRSRQGEAEVDESFTGQITLGEVIAQFDAGFRAPLRTHLEVVGSDGVITAAAPFKPGPGAHLLLSRGERRRSLRWKTNRSTSASSTTSPMPRRASVSRG